ncbi:hypothetical protein IC575_002269 [Cucumis melo]
MARHGKRFVPSWLQEYNKHFSAQILLLRRSAHRVKSGSKLPSRYYISRFAHLDDKAFWWRVNHENVILTRIKNLQIQVSTGRSTFTTAP